MGLMVRHHRSGESAEWFFRSMFPLFSGIFFFLHWMLKLYKWNNFSNIYYQYFLLGGFFCKINRNGVYIFSGSFGCMMIRALISPRVSAD